MSRYTITEDGSRTTYDPGKMKRTALDALARDLGISNPDHFNLAELREWVEARLEALTSEVDGVTL